jgi:putative phage-type endonuclease
MVQESGQQVTIGSIQQRKKMTELYREVEQGTDAWLEIRRGKVTGSRVADVLAKTKTGVSASRANYMIELALQRVTGVIEPSYTNDAMQWGKDNEQTARTAFEVAHNVFVDQVAFVDHPTIKDFGCSPDGIIGDSLLELKCPYQSAVHWSYFKDGCPSKYYTQIQAQMSCTGAKSVWFVSFDPRMPSKSQLYIEEVLRDADFIEKLESEVKQFLNEVEVESNLMRGE